MTEIAFSSSFKRAFRNRIAGRKPLEKRFWKRVEMFRNNPHDAPLRTHKLSGDQVDWRFEDGEIRGRKLTPQAGLRQIVARLITKDGALVADTSGLTIDSEAIAEAVRNERDR